MMDSRHRLFHIGICTFLSLMILHPAVGLGPPPLPPPLANYVAKPATWASKLVGQDMMINDTEFADWVKAAQTAAAGLPNPQPFTFIATFTQCFSGGFLTELKNKAVVDFGANSACRYFEGASYDDNRSYYAYAWSRTLALNLAATDRSITITAETKLHDGNSPAKPTNIIRDNPNLANEAVQYLEDIVGGVPPQALNVANPKFAILFVGKPENSPQDLQDFKDIHASLLAAGYLAANIHVLYGNIAPGAIPNAGGINSNGKATHANLMKAFTDTVANNGFLLSKLNGLAANSPKAQVFFWSGDHGNICTPISFSVNPVSVGNAGSAVNARSIGGLPVESMVYEGGQGANLAGWQDPVFPPAIRDIDAISFGNDKFPIGSQPPQGIYFSVTPLSAGKDGSDVKRFQIGALHASPDVFVKTWKQNRQAMDGDVILDLLEAAAGGDDLNALTFGNINDVLIAGVLQVPLFFSVAGSAKILVSDPLIAGGAPYVWWDPALAWVGPLPVPLEIDAIAIKTSFTRNGPGGPDANKLIFFAGDKILFSIGLQPAPAPDPCDLIMWDFVGANPPAVKVTCDQLGLIPKDLIAMPPIMADDVNAMSVYDQTGPSKAPSLPCAEDCATPKDGNVNVTDLLLLLANWGGPGSCDINGDGLIGVTDLLAIFGAWGACP